MWGLSLLVCGSGYNCVGGGLLVCDSFVRGLMMV